MFFLVIVIFLAVVLPLKTNSCIARLAVSACVTGAGIVALAVAFYTAVSVGILDPPPSSTTTTSEVASSSALASPARSSKISGQSSPASTPETARRSRPVRTPPVHATVNPGVYNKVQASHTKKDIDALAGCSGQLIYGDVSGSAFWVWCDFQIQDKGAISKQGVSDFPSQHPNALLVSFSDGISTAKQMGDSWHRFRNETVAKKTAPSSTHSNSAGSHWVNGYRRRDGTYVEGHYKTNSDETQYNNWSTRGNVNPYTKRRGYAVPTH